MKCHFNMFYTLGFRIKIHLGKKFHLPLLKICKLFLDCLFSAIDLKNIKVL